MKEHWKLIQQHLGLDADGIPGPRTAQALMEKLGSRITPYGTTLLTSIVTSAISCNQTLAIMLTSQLCGENNPEKSSFALDLENTVVVIAPMIPWSIAGAVPLAAIGAPNISIAVAFYLYLLPLWGLAVHLTKPSDPSPNDTSYKKVKNAFVYPSINKSISK